MNGSDSSRQDRAAFQQRFDVSRETLERLDQFSALLNRWQAKINLVGPKTLETLWRRHLWDSAQIRDHLPPGDLSLLDMGSGAGLPGIVLAAMAPCTVHSVESDGRKIAFQRQAALTMGCSNKVVLHNKRVETLAPVLPDVITARAFAPLQKLLELGYDHARSDTLWILPKGQNVEDELKEATKCWTFHVEQVHSETDKNAKILLINSVRRL